ncbi:protein MCM10 homolog [Anoplophora glabripennis]|uniref:protein MCM10 homolog n=1 Tax=Anoplophora glabripennis TaxID=217634 RepID=UPI000C769D1A|nr:protein MCM10 homolog [Anoplophora glabripennis]
MSENDDLLANLLSVATEELNNLSKNNLKEADIFKQESNLITNKICGNDSRSLIHKGDTDSSEDEENRIQEKKYNEFGRNIKQQLQTTSSSYDKQQGSSWKMKSSFISSAQTPISSLSKRSNEPAKRDDIYTDPIFGMRIVKPLISSATLKERMVGREAVPFARINNYLQTCHKEKDWVIAGVIANKSAVKTSQKGTQFCIWTLTDLKNDIKTISLFLFSKAHKELWKTVVGTIVGVLNPNVLDRKDGSKDEACLSVDNPQRVLILGLSKDFGTCKSLKKNGEQCNAIVNLNQCEYCIYHIKQEYQKCSKRSELQANFVGRGLTALRNKVLGKNEVFYAGKSYMAIPAKKSKKLEVRDSSRLVSLSGKSTNIISNNKKVKNTNMSKKMNAARLDVSPAQKLRDMELLKKLEGSFGLETKNSFSGKHSADVSLKESKNLAMNVIDKIKSKNSIPNTLKDNDTSIINELVVSKDIDSNQTLLNKSDTLEGNKQVGENINTLHIDYSSITPTLNASSVYNKESSKETISSQSRSNQFSMQQLTCRTFASKVSQLKKFQGGLNTVIDLNTPITNKLENRAKLNAIKFVQKNGSIKKTDPNSTRTYGRKRTIEEVEKSESISKKSKLADSEFISDRFKKMMETTSKHTDLLECRDDEEKEKYFKKLEIKEKMEEKMINTHKVPCKAVQCLKCKYTSFSASDLCKSERHPLKVFDAMKRFFKCGDCGNRTVTLKIIPVGPCKNCQSGNWQKSGMMKDKSVLTHSLSIRGGEQKFVNSVVTDQNINLLVPMDD